MSEDTPKKYSTESTYILVGRLIKDPEVRTLPDGKQLLKLTQVDGTKSDKHQSFFPETTVGGPRVEFLSKARKGDVVKVEGKLEMRTYEKRDGSIGIAMEVRFPRSVEVYADLRERTPVAAAAPGGGATDDPF